MNHVSDKVASHEGGMGACMLPQKIWNFDALKRHLYCSQETILMSGVCSQMSDFMCLSWDVWFQVFDIRCLMSGSVIRRLMSGVSSQTSDFRCLIWDVWCQTSDFRRLTLNIWIRCGFSDVWFQMSDVRRFMAAVWYQTSDVRCRLSDVWYQVSDVRCLMSGVWCQTPDLSGSDLCF